MAVISKTRLHLTGKPLLNGEETFAIELRPSPEEKDSERIRLWISADDFIPRKTEWTSGTLTLTTTLVSVKKNLALKKELFEFQKPQDAEMVDFP